VCTSRAQIENSPELLKQLNPYEELLSKEAGSMPYRQTLQLISLAEASAISRGDDKITQEDIDTVAYLCNWINYKMEAI
jgi:hypothetical protein